MWWSKYRIDRRGLGRVAFVLTAASLTGGCFVPLYGARPDGSETVRDKLVAVDIPAFTAQKGTDAARLAVALRNALQYNFNGGAGPIAPTHRLTGNIATSALTVVVDLTSGRPDAEVGVVNASFQLVEIATGKVVLRDTTFAHVDFDIPGSEQRFAAQSAQADAENRATQVVAAAIRNRVTSYFVAGT